jgi:allophanate hydrolase subunit 2
MTQGPDPVVRSQDDHFLKSGMTTFLEAEFTVSVNADRMGYRLTGPAISHKPCLKGGIISEPSVPGGVQVPPDGRPIILLTEQTIGGYAKIATVISVDIGLVAQTRPGDRIAFSAVSIDLAHRLLRAREETFAGLAALFPPSDY